MGARTAYLIDKYYNDQLEQQELSELYRLITNGDQADIHTAIADSIQQQLAGYHTLSAEEAQQNFTLFNRLADDALKVDRAAISASIPMGAMVKTSATAEIPVENILTENIPTESTVAAYKTGSIIRFLRNWRVAAVILLLVGSGLYVLLNENTGERPTTITASPSRAPFPEVNEAVLLTLANGETIALDSTGNIPLAAQSGMRLSLENGQLSYKTDSPLTNESITTTFNTLTTPRGMQFRLVLSDGTKVWLNAASSITYPTVFNTAERKVSITGEAYFEVNKIDLPASVGGNGANASNPVQFIVASRNHEVVVTGTSFNINSYEEEEHALTSLLEGRVSIRLPRSEGRKNSIERELIPGQQAIVTTDQASGTTMEIRTADVMQSIAWRKGEYRFKSAGIATIMRQIARWYDVEVIYEGTIPKALFSGVVLRKDNVLQLLEALENTGDVHFETEGRKIIVTGKK